MSAVETLAWAVACRPHDESPEVAVDAVLASWPRPSNDDGRVWDLMRVRMIEAVPGIRLAVASAPFNPRFHGKGLKQMLDEL